MAYTDFPGTRNIRHVRRIYFTITAAADIQAAGAAGYVITRGSPEIASVVRSAEGVMVITLDAVYINLLALVITPINIDDVVPSRDAFDMAARTITLTWRQQSTEAVAASDKDPDSAVFIGYIDVEDETLSLTA